MKNSHEFIGIPFIWGIMSFGSICILSWFSKFITHRCFCPNLSKQDFNKVHIKIQCKRKNEITQDLKYKTLWKMYLYSYCFGVIFPCDSLFRPVVKPVSKVNLYFFSAGGRSFLDESHLGSFACLVSILVEALLSVALKCTWITFQCSQLGFDLDHKRNSFSNRVWRGVYCH